MYPQLNGLKKRLLVDHLLTRQHTFDCVNSHFCWTQLLVAGSVTYSHNGLAGWCWNLPQELQLLTDSLTRTSLMLARQGLEGNLVDFDDWMWGWLQIYQTLSYRKGGMLWYQKMMKWLRYPEHWTLNCTRIFHVCSTSLTEGTQYS